MKSPNNSEGLISYLKSKKLESIPLILLDIFMPFERVLLSFATFSIPLFGLLLGAKRAENIENFLKDETPLQRLKDELEKGIK